VKCYMHRSLYGDSWAAVVMTSLSASAIGSQMKMRMSDPLGTASRKMDLRTGPARLRGNNITRLLLVAIGRSKGQRLSDDQEACRRRSLPVPGAGKLGRNPE